MPIFTAAVITFTPDGGQDFRSIAWGGVDATEAGPHAATTFESRNEAWRALHVERQRFEEEMDGYIDAPYTTASKVLGYLRGDTITDYWESVDKFIRTSPQYDDQIRGGFVGGTLYSRTLGIPDLRSSHLQGIDALEIRTDLEWIDLALDLDNPSNGHFARYIVQKVS